MGHRVHELDQLLFRIRTLAAQGKVRFTAKALEELWELDLGLDSDDAIQILQDLVPRDLKSRLISRLTGESMYVFSPTVANVALYLKLIVRTECVIISFHQDADDDAEA